MHFIFPKTKHSTRIKFRKENFTRIFQSTGEAIEFLNEPIQKDYIVEFKGLLS